jgi:hypothetical protein
MKYDAEEAELRRQVDQAEEKRAWFHKFRDRVETVAEFLDEKVGAVTLLAGVIPGSSILLTCVCCS